MSTCCVSGTTYSQACVDQLGAATPCIDQAATGCSASATCDCTDAYGASTCSSFATQAGGWSSLCRINGLTVNTNWRNCQESCVLGFSDAG